MKIVINTCFGGFGLSDKALSMLSGAPYDYDASDMRTDPELVRVVEELGEKANCLHSQLRVLEIPDDVRYYIDDYDGIESVHEVHRVWY